MNPITQAVSNRTVSAGAGIQLNSADVAAKEIDGEILVMNVANGMYYSLDGVSARTWELLVAGHSIGQVCFALARLYGVDEPRVLADVTELVIHLLDEGLVTVSDSPSPDMPAVAPLHERTPYVAPSLTSYSDMADLLALDPPMPGLAETSFIPQEEV